MISTKSNNSAQSTENSTNAPSAAASESHGALGGQRMPPVERAGTNRLSRAVGALVLAVALGSEGELRAQDAPAAGPAQPTPAAAPSQQVAKNKTDITLLERRPFCMDNDGTLMTATSRNCQVRNHGSRIQDCPTTGTALQALACGLEHLQQLNGGKIPAGHTVKARVKDGETETTLPLNHACIPAVSELGPVSHRIACNDPLTGKAIKFLQNNIDVFVQNDRGTFTMLFVSRTQAPFSLTLELEAPKKK